MYDNSNVRLYATVTPAKCPYLDSPIRICNKYILSIRGGSIIFYVTASTVLMVKRVIRPIDISKDEDYSRMTPETFVSEIRVPIEVVLT